MQPKPNSVITVDELLLLMSSKHLSFDMASTELIHRYSRDVIVRLYNYLDHDGMSVFYSETRKLGLHVFMSSLP